MIALRECICSYPIPYVAPHKVHTCCACGYSIAVRWTSNDITVRAFFDRLEASVPGEDLSAFRAHCERRERDGRVRFGHTFLKRQNLDEGAEEAADLALYSMLDSLRARREGRGDEDIALALTAALHASRAYTALLHLKARRGGAP